jgi:glutamyl-tRNA synthetase
MSETVTTRFAPSPTGRLHIGNVRTALFNALAARAAEGKFILRVEDTDAARSKPEWHDALLDDLRWLGLEWSEGPDVGGPSGPYEQSARAAIYARYYDDLIGAERAYPCFCTPEELARSRKAQLAAGRPPRYAGTCAHLSDAEIESRRRQGLSSALRFRVPANVDVQFDDAVRGPQHFASGAIGDFIIRKADGAPAFFFCNAVDDALMGVTLVLRGEDHLANTPRQLLLLDALELTAPHYGHLGLLIGDDGAPLAKRHGSASLDDLRMAGFLPVAVLNDLARLGHHYADDPGLTDVDGLAGNFKLNRLGASPAHFDRAQLEHWQREAVEGASDEALWEWMAEAVGDLVPAGQSSDFVRTIRHNITMPRDARAWAHSLYSGEDWLGGKARQTLSDTTAGLFDAALRELDAGEDFKAWIKAVSAAANVKGKALYMPLRAALTGELHGPELARVWTLLGTYRIRARLEAARRVASQ